LDNIVVSVKDLSKEYIIYNGQVDRLKSVLGLNKNQRKLIALSKISFNVKKGDVVGILGRNGSGKSTLLKILTKITYPTTGDFNINGSVALLQIGTGLIGEMTGIENIFLKGKMMGFSKREIEKKKQSIIDFSELNSFIDQPLKNYSSGMKARLGFAIAINIDPDILIIDEALAVGDEAFRLKCLSKIKEFKENKKTILYVSHSRDSVLSFCNKAMWLNNGVLEYFGDVSTATKKYDDFMKSQKKQIAKKNKNNGKTKIDYILLKKSRFSNDKIYDADDIICIDIEYIIKESIGELFYFVEINDENQKLIVSSLNDIEKDKTIIDSSLGEHKFNITIKKHYLNKGSYFISVGVIDKSGLIRMPLIFKNKIEVINSKLPKFEGVQL
jgi:ABC-type polysaccharide/polyol phosphate transport system ATPase subunit